MPRLALLSTALAALACGLAGAAEAEGVALDAKAAAELRNQVRALHTEASKRSDVWTALQIEGWARQQPDAAQRLLDLKLRPLLVGSIVYGDPTFAFPSRILAWADRGEQVVVATRSHCHVLAPDGRPLSLAWPWPRPVGMAVIATGGDIAGAIAATKDADDFVFLSQSLVDGHPILDKAISRKEGEGPSGPLVIAADGSAMAIAVSRDGHPRVLVGGGRGPGAIKRFTNARGIGPDGRWLICEDGDGHPVLLVDGKPVTGSTIADEDGDEEAPGKAKGAKRTRDAILTDAAIGPGLALVVAPGHAGVVGLDATLTMLDPPIGIGPSPRALSVGGWVALWSGPEAKTKASADVLGNPIPGGQPQPPTIALYRWKDLAAHPATAPALVLENDQLARDDAEPDALFLWRDAQLDLIDLSGDQPGVRPLYTAPSRIAALSPATAAVILQLEDHGRVIVDHLGRELWSGKGEATLPHPRWLLQRGDNARAPFTLTHLDPDPAQRQQLALDLPDGAWQFGYDPLAEQLVAWQPNGAWTSIDARTGARIDDDQDGDDDHPRPAVEQVSTQPGRFTAAPDSARLTRKLAARDLAAQQWEPADAWRLQQHDLLVLERSGQVLAYGAGRKGFKLVGRCRRGDRLVGDANHPVIADDDGKPLAALTAGGSLNRDLPARMRKPEDLPGGAWRVDNSDLSFATPKSGMLVWNTERVGFAPRRLRSPDNGGMLVITDSLVIELDPAAAKVVGKAK